jgi:hypothetical protein
VKIHSNILPDQPHQFLKFPLMLDRSRWYNPPMPKPKRPRDVNQLAKMIVDISTGNAPPELESNKNPAAVALGKGEKGDIQNFYSYAIIDGCHL